MPPILRRIAETDRERVRFRLDGVELEALAGDTLLSAILTNGSVLRHTEFSDRPRSGFCLMGACQDCVVWTGDGARLRACTTPVAAGMALSTRTPAAAWPSLG